MAAAKSKKLLIVESPTKAKTIKKYLGSDYVVKASVGHIRDLKSPGWGKTGFGIDIENGYEPQYVVIKGKEKVISELKEAAAKAAEVYLAPDPDREGEAIAWHLKEVLDLPDDEARRITYQAVTKKAVTEALDHPRSIDMHLVDAQKGRRVLDRLVGFSLSPFLWKKVTKNLSAGRVQSVAMRMIVEREREIAAFVPEEFWKITAILFPAAGEKTLFEAQLVRWKGKKFGLGNPAAQNGTDAGSIADILRNADWSVADVAKKRTSRKAPAPFTTSTLQQAASSQLSFGTSRTMRVAQQLYEGVETGEGVTGLITYMRTDSTRIDGEALRETREWIAGQKNLAGVLSDEPAAYGKAGKNAQDAHECVRPTNVALTPEAMEPHLTKEQQRLYALIWRRFVASQLKPARYDVTTITVAAAEGELEAKGRVTVDPGYTVLTPEKQEKGDQKYQDLPAVAGGDALGLEDLNAEQNFTKPPARFSEASLVKALEKEGIGRPSTYANIIKTITDRGYVRLEKRAFHANELGMAVNDMLVNNFADIMDYRFTAGMEDSLDRIEGGEVDWHRLVDQFYRPFAERVETATKEAEPLKGRPWTGEEKCPVCGSDLVLRYSKSGAFLGCSTYPECKGLLPMPGEKGDDEEEAAEGPQVDCPTCGRPMIRKKSRYGKDFLACTGYPDCKTTLNLDAQGEPVYLPDISMDCDECGTPMEMKSKKRGPVLVCPNNDCRRELPVDKDGKVASLPKAKGIKCEKCGSPMIVRLSRRGPFLACTGFPKCRNAKNLDKDGNVVEKKEKADKKDD